MREKITKIISLSAAAACLITGLKIAPVYVYTDADAAVELAPFEITEEMQLGWNLGNTLDATSAAAKPGLSSETAWGNPKTTKEMIHAVKAKGFNTIRIPTTWYQHLDENNTIEPEWLARVKEIIDWCYEEDMYVILNVHHENWVNRADLGTAYDEMKVKLMAIWSQVGEYFKDYDQHLVFECMNEPRAAGTDHEWWGPTQAEVDTINKLNADFVELIRSIDSPYSDTRLLMIPDYCASSDSSIYSKLVVPEDEYVAVSIHAYSPYGFTMDNKASHDTYTSAYSNELHSILKGIRDTFTDKGIPVVLGEFSSSNFGNTEARVEWANDYISTMKAYGIPCVLWDNNVIDNPGDPGEAHGYLNRSDLSWYAPSEPVIDEMLKVLADKSIVWGSERKAPVIEHDDIDSGKTVFEGPVDIDASVENGNCSESRPVTWAELEGNDVAVQFTGDTPVLAFMDGNWKNWTEIKPYDVDSEKGIAYYSSTDIAAAWGEDKLDELAHMLTRTNSKTTIIKIAIIKASGAEIVPPAPTAKVYTLDLTNTGRAGELIISVVGEPNTSTNGCLGFMKDGEWAQIEWEGKTDADGHLIVRIQMEDIPADVNTPQFQIWLNFDVLDMEDYNIVTPPGPLPTEPPTDEPTTDEPLRWGDANDDGVVSIADATAILQHLGNKDKYALTAIGALQADVDETAGITANDAIVIQQVDAGLISLSALPLRDATK